MSKFVDLFQFRKKPYGNIEFALRMGDACEAVRSLQGRAALGCRSTTAPQQLTLGGNFRT